MTSVIFLLSAVIASNIYSRNSDFQNDSILFKYLDGKGGFDDNGENIVVKSLETNTAIPDSFVSIAKIASADPNFAVNMANSANNNEINEIPLGSSDNQAGSDNNSDSSDPISIVQGNFVMAPASYYDESLANAKYGIVKYIVQDGDTPSSIATAFGISTYTVLWANNLKVGDYIKPGQELQILPVTGVIHTIKNGDTVEKIANMYKAEKDEIIAFNSLPADGLFPQGSEGKIVIVPNGEKEAPLRPRVIAPRDPNDRKVVSSKKVRPSNLNPMGGHQFPYGQCTWYVASKIYIPWGGDAKMWLANSKAYGYKSGKTPVVGSIMVTTENKRYGHVAIVEAINGDNITISDMNYVGWGRVSVRVLKTSSPVIRGYIYVP